MWRCSDGEVTRGTEVTDSLAPWCPSRVVMSDGAGRRGASRAPHARGRRRVASCSCCCSSRRACDWRRSHRSVLLDGALQTSTSHCASTSPQRGRPHDSASSSTSPRRGSTSVSQRRLPQLHLLRVRAGGDASPWAAQRHHPPPPCEAATTEQGSE
jgi:hypothetical protein